MTAADTTNQVPAIARCAEFRGKVDFGIITIRVDEFEAVLERFPPKWLAQGEAQYSIAKVSSRSGATLYVATMRIVGQGHDAAHTATTRLLEDLDPTCIVLVGIGGAKPESEFTLGDVMVATRAHDFSVTAVLPSGKIETAAAGQPIHPLVQTAVVNLPAAKAILGNWNSNQSIGRELPAVHFLSRNFLGDAKWNKKIKDSLMQRFGTGAISRQPLVVDGAIASGNTLMKNQKMFESWLEHARDLKGVEMELPGVLAAVRSIRGERPVLAIRGISDVVGFVRDPAWTAYACHAAAAFAKAFLTSELLDIEIKSKVSSKNKGYANAPGWQLSPAWHLRADFARLYVEPQPPGGSPDRFTLTTSVTLASIYLKVQETPDSSPISVTVRPSAVEMIPYEKNMQPIFGTVVGRDKKVANVDYRGFWHILNPKGQNADTVAGLPMCDMRLLENGPYSVELELRCKDTDLDIEFGNLPPDVSEKQLAVLRRVLQRLGCPDDQAEYINLSSAEIHREE